MQRADFLLLSLPVSLGQFKKRFAYNKVRALLGLLAYMLVALLFVYTLMVIISQDLSLTIYRLVALVVITVAITLIYFRREGPDWAIVLDLYEGGFVLKDAEGTRVVLWSSIGELSDLGRGPGLVVDLLPERAGRTDGPPEASEPPERESIWVTSKIAGIDELSIAIQEGAAANLALQLDHAIRSGESFAFGPIVVSASGLAVGEGQDQRFLAWGDTKRVLLENHRYSSPTREEITIISRKGGSFYDDGWAHVNAYDVPQHAILLALCKRFIDRASQES